MEPTKKNLILLGVTGFISILILVAGLVLILSSPKPMTNPASPKEPQTTEAVQDIVRRALDTRAPSLCDAIHDDAKRAYCKDNVL